MVNSHNLCVFLGKSLGTSEDEKMLFQHLFFFTNTRESMETNDQNMCLSFFYTMNNQKQTKPKCVFNRSLNDMTCPVPTDTLFKINNYFPQ